MQSIFHAGLLFLHFDFGRSTDLDEGNAARQLRHAFLKLFTVVVARGGIDLLTDVLHAFGDGFGLAGAVDDRGVFLRHFDALGGTELFKRRLIKRKTQIRRDDGGTRQNGNVFEHGLAAVAEARGLHGDNLQDAADGVHDERSKGFAVHVFSDDEKRTTGLRNLFEHGEEIADVADLLVVQEYERIFKHGGLTFRRVDEVGGEVAAVKLHAFHDFEFVIKALAVFDRDHAFLADLFHGLGDDVADLSVGVRADGADLSHFLVGRGGLGDLLQFFDGGGNGLVDTALQIHRIHAGSHILHAFVNDGLSEHRGGRRTVAGVVVGLRSHFAHHLGAHAFKLVLEVDFLSNGNAVLRDERTAEGAFEHHVAALGPQRNLHRVGERVDTANHADAGVITEKNLFSSHLTESPKIVCLK